ncbi:hypothetical protein [Paenisporosarcina sp. TG20]|uniref:hypothetical protein n=1 Tax=Paenisporosarcina sp. TG20 TaxID=1211706 RepID=UPI0003193A58|nr:hypothetical protein [Paenisporosarcina sp. TG20]
MTFSTIIGVLILGLVILVVGFIAKKRWIKIVSIIPLSVAGWQLVSLFAMG